MSITLRDNQLFVEPDSRTTATVVDKKVSLPSPVSLPRSIPARKLAILGDLSAAGEMSHCESLTETITSPNTGVIYHYCGVSDGIAYYRSADELADLSESEKEMAKR